MTHLTREAANLASRQPGIKGSTQWATNINNGMNQAITAASPVINLAGTGPTGPGQFKVYYSMVEWNPAAGACGGGPIASGAADNYQDQANQRGMDRQHRYVGVRLAGTGEPSRRRWHLRLSYAAGGEEFVNVGDRPPHC